MNIFSENKELIQEFSKTFDVEVVDICNFIRNTQEENKYFDYAKGLKTGLKKLSEKYHNQYILVDSEYIKIDEFEIDDCSVILKGKSIEFYDDCDYREEIELTYDCSNWFCSIEYNVTTIEAIEKKIESRLISVDEMKKIFNENFDAYRERFYHNMFGVN